jgi:hypothetical protein
MAKGFDTRADCTALAVPIQAAGYDFVARYLSIVPSKVIGPAEASALHAAGLLIVLVYEDGPTSADYFTPDRGTKDGLRAAQQASLLTAPGGTIIYFAVDYDAQNDDVAKAITPYFQAVNNALKTFAATGGVQYSAGSYGSGAVCSTLMTAGLVTAGWRSNSTGWSGYGTYSDWSISQSLPDIVLGISVDPDLAVGTNYGGF